MHTRQCQACEEIEQRQASTPRANIWKLQGGSTPDQAQLIKKSSRPGGVLGYEHGKGYKDRLHSRHAHARKQKTSGVGWVMTGDGSGN